jgi:hypothetical protein
MVVLDDTVKVLRCDGNGGEQLNMDLNGVLRVLCEAAGVAETDVATIKRFWTYAEGFVLEELMTYNALKCNAVLAPIVKEFFSSPKPADEKAAKRWMKLYEEDFTKSIA